MIEKFPRSTLRHILDSGEGQVSDKIVDHARWSVEHELVFTHLDRYWRTSYSVGATESQDEQPWEYEEEVDCVEVRPVEKKVIVFEEVP